MLVRSLFIFTRNCTDALIRWLALNHKRYFQKALATRRVVPLPFANQSNPSATSEPLQSQVSITGEHGDEPMENVDQQQHYQQQNSEVDIFKEREEFDDMRKGLAVFCLQIVEMYNDNKKGVFLRM